MKKLERSRTTEKGKEKGTINYEGRGKVKVVYQWKCKKGRM